MLAEHTHLARPYAKAAFEIALKLQKLDSWVVFLQTAAQIVEAGEAQLLLHHPLITPEQLVQLFQELLPEAQAEERNFIRLLAQYRRLILLASIAKLFKSLFDKYKQVISVDVFTTVALTAQQQEKLIAALEQRLERQVLLNPHIKADLLGGFLIKAEDYIIDHTLRGKLNRLGAMLVQD